jgi:predicted lipoprotein with Yx(FWY)xxD motif
VVVVIAAVLVLAACVIGVGHVEQPVAAAAEEPTTVGAPPAAGAAPATLATRDTPLGTVATSDEFTVYQFAKDTSNPPASMCTGACAKAWPPVMASDQLALKGVSVAEVGTVTRPDGGVQITLGGWPVYRYAKDKAPGDTTGQGVGGTWSALGPNGKPIKTAAAGSSAAPASPAAGATGSCTTTAPAASTDTDTGTGTGTTVDPINPTAAAASTSPASNTGAQSTDTGGSQGSDSGGY